MLVRLLMPALVLLSACTADKGGAGGADSAVGDTAPGPELDVLAAVDPFIGTGGLGYGFGGSYPGPGRPFGLVKVSPDTANHANIAPGFSHTGGYYHPDDHIRGFSHLHMQGVGIAAYGALGLMPADGFSDEKITAEGHLQAFSHDDERAGAGWYEVDFTDLDVQVALSATDHTALHRYTFGGGVSEPTVLIDLAHVIGGGIVPGGEIAVDAESSRVEGWLICDGEMGAPFPLYFSILFDQAPSSWGVWTGEEITAGGATALLPEELFTGTDKDEPVPLGAWLTFDGADEVYARVGLSKVDVEGARANLDAEHTGFDYAAERAAAAADWEERLSVVRVWGGSERDRTIFASSVFKAAQMPTLYSDADGRYLAFDGEVRQAEWGRYYTDFSLWDTYRTAHPLYLLLWPEDAADMMDSLASMARYGGGVARWPLADTDPGVMLGTPANIVFAEAYLKGVDDFDVDTLAEVALGIADGTGAAPFGGRPDVATYDALGFHPAESVGRSVAWTQELAISDHALGLLMEARGESDAAAMLLERAGWWRNHYNSETGYFHARMTDGSFVEIESEAAWDDAYTEGNARQYRWLVPHDPEGLFAEMGGEEQAVQWLSELFEGRAEELEELGETGFPSSWYWHGNEPDIHAAWMFALAGRPDLTREWVGWVMDHEYSELPSGVDGNDDGGTLASWFVFAAAGLYPLNGTDRYVLGEPRFDRIEMAVAGPGEPYLTIERVGQGDDIVEIQLDGVPIAGVELRHADLRPGAVLTFVAGTAR